MISHHPDRDYSCSECQGRRRAAPSRSSCGVRSLSERASLSRLHVLRLTIAERPVFLLHLEVDDHVFAPQVEPLMESIDSRFVEGLLLLEGSVKPRRLQAAGPTALLWSESRARTLVH
jgi:hypothetical protein